MATYKIVFRRYDNTQQAFQVSDSLEDAITDLKAYFMDVLGDYSRIELLAVKRMPDKLER